MKACQYCHNLFEADNHADHEQLCAKNPSNLEKERKKGEIERYVKTVVLKDGAIVGMYEAHAGENKVDPDEEIERIQKVWETLWPESEHTSVPFLRARGFRVVFQ